MSATVGLDDRIMPCNGKRADGVGKKAKSKIQVHYKYHRLRIQILRFLKILKIRQFFRILKCQRILKIKFVS